MNGNQSSPGSIGEAGAAWGRKAWNRRSPPGANRHYVLTDEYMRTEDCSSATVALSDLSRGFKSFGYGVGGFEQRATTHQRRKRSLWLPSDETGPCRCEATDRRATRGPEASTHLGWVGDSLASTSLPLSKQSRKKAMNQIWTDGACEPNPGFGGWGYLMLRQDGCHVEDCGGEVGTTNNRMEMVAILAALRALPDRAHAVVYSDSQYCVNGLTIWSAAWEKRQWRKKDGTDMPNRDLWLLLHAQKQRLKAGFKWIRGHNGDAGNERADALAAIGRTKVAP